MTMFTRLLETHRVATLTELIEALEALRVSVLTEGDDPDFVYVVGDERPCLDLTLVRRTLTDESVVFDVAVH